MSIAEVDSLLEVSCALVDLVKLGWGTAVVTPNLQAKLERYTSAGVPVVLGGTLTEIAIRQGRVDGLIEWMRESGCATWRSRTGRSRSTGTSSGS